MTRFRRIRLELLCKPRTAVSSAERVVCNCHKVTEGVLCDAIAAGADTLPALCDATRAGTGLRLVQGSIDAAARAAAEA